ncbi:hypothetical protein SLS62_001319 [Diatrype stigma]|uniref:Uncharacterized protein n=1 Tax=Diatrype stigma TaxID=117547 RepID=A0AAN9YWJ5_9PEZI
MALIPQIITNYRRHNTTGLQPAMMVLWALAGLPLGVYNIVGGFNIALQVQPQILTSLSLATWAQCQYYGAGWRARRAASAVAAIGLVMAGVELGLVYALRKGRGRGKSDPDRVEWPMTLMAALAAALLAAGVLSHYWDIYRTRSVRGISFLFVGIDALGDLASLLSVCFQPPPLDVLGLVVYGTELALWIGVMVCGVVFNLRPWIKSKRKKKGDESQ